MALDVLSLPADVLADPAFEAALELALSIYQDERQVLPLAVETWADAEVIKAA